MENVIEWVLGAFAWAVWGLLVAWCVIDMVKAIKGLKSKKKED